MAKHLQYFQEYDFQVLYLGWVNKTRLELKFDKWQWEEQF